MNTARPKTSSPPPDEESASDQAPGGHQLVGHTADIGIRCWGATPTALFREAALALIEVMFGRIQVGGHRPVDIALQGENLEELLVAWLNELIFLFDARGLIPAHIDIIRLEQTRLQARLKMADDDARRWSLERQVKAATYHQLEVSASAACWRATIYLDL